MNKEEMAALWEPAKPGEEAPEEVWVPNRVQRRAMGKKKNQRKGLKNLLGLTKNAKEFVKDDKDFRQQMYKELYENLKNKTENIEEKLKEQDENGADAD